MIRVPKRTAWWRWHNSLLRRITPLASLLAIIVISGCGSQSPTYSTNGPYDSPATSPLPEPSATVLPHGIKVACRWYSEQTGNPAHKHSCREHIGPRDSIARLTFIFVGLTEGQWYDLTNCEMVGCKPDYSFTSTDLDGTVPFGNSVDDNSLSRDPQTGQISGGNPAAHVTVTVNVLASELPGTYTLTLANQDHPGLAKTFKIRLH